MIVSHFIKPSLHFLIYGALLLMCGIVAATYFPLTTLLYVGFLIFMVLTICIPRWFILTLCFIFFVVGAWRYQSLIEDHFDFFNAVQEKTFSAQGIITGIDFQNHTRMQQKLTVTIDNFTPYAGSTIFTKRTIQIYLTKKTDAQVADYIELHDLVLKKNDNFSYEHYLIKEQISATIFLPALDYTLINRPKNSCVRWLFYFKQRLLNRCKKKLSPATFSFFASVFLGNKMYEKKYMENPKNHCKTWGISHYLARSGLHMVIFIYICYLLLCFLPIPFVLKQIILICIGILYYILSWPSISFIRAFLSFLLFKACTLLQVPSQLIHLLSIVTISVLLYNPMQLFFLDFQLSFGLTFALAWFNAISAQKSYLAIKY